MSKKVLIIGNGGREHALLKAIQSSDSSIETFSYPGSCGMEKDGCKSVKIRVDKWEELAKWAKDNKITLAIVGPELPLTEGIVDIFSEYNIPAFGPSKLAAQLEGSKYFSKKIM